MPRCSNCGEWVEEDDAFCRHCGAEFICPECGGSGKVEWGSEASGMPLITKGAPGASKYVKCPRCHGTGRL